MNEQDIRRTTPEATNPRVGILRDFRVDFTLNVESRKGGVADLVESPGDETHGIVWEVPNFATLDYREEHPYVYRRREITVEIDGNNEPVSTYSVMHKNQSVRPSATYLDLLQDSVLPLDPAYVKKLTAYALSLPLGGKPEPLWRVLFTKENEIWGENFHSVWEAIETMLHHKNKGHHAQLIHRFTEKFHDAFPYSSDSKTVNEID